MPGQRAELRIREARISAFGITAGPQPHKLDLGLNAGRGFDVGELVREVAVFPWKPR